jgi:hypothetical protein
VELSPGLGASELAQRPMVSGLFAPRWCCRPHKSEIGPPTHLPNTSSRHCTRRHSFHPSFPAGMASSQGLPAKEQAGELLCCVVELDRDAWTSALADGTEEGESPAELVGRLFQAFVGLVTAHRLSGTDHRVAVVGFGRGWTHPIISLEAAASASVSECHAALRGACIERMGIDVAAPPAEPSAKRVDRKPFTVEEREGPPEPCLSSALARGFLFCQRFRQRVPGAKSRILALCASPDPPHQYIPVINTAFAARDSGILIDAVAAAPPDGEESRTVFLQQAVHESGGWIVSADKEFLKAPLQGMVSCFLVPSSDRGAMRGPEKAKVDLRATSITTGERCSIAYVCFVCLGVFDSWHDECPLCHTRAPPGAKPN